MDLKEFVRDNRELIDKEIFREIVQGRFPKTKTKFTDKERCFWLSSNDALREWAEGEGCFFE